ncbi:MAG: hypothetical protein M3Z67_06605 [Commensalibacter sp.]|nr:hypothetical protein [Commensalibacter sp.]
MPQPFIRISLIGLIVASFGFSQAVYANNAACHNSPAHEAFNVQGLKSELMVTALSCNAQTQYNDFITKFRPVLATQETKLNSYFRTTYGRQAQKAHDDYITQLANVQSSQGLKAGTIFCLQRLNMFDEIKYLNTSSDLSEYADAKDIVQPTSFEICSAPTSKATKHTRTRARAKHRRS